MTGLSPNKALQLTLRVVSTAPRMVIRRLVREARPNPAMRVRHEY